MPEAGLAIVRFTGRRLPNYVNALLYAEVIRLLRGRDLRRPFSVGTYLGGHVRSTGEVVGFGSIRGIQCQAEVAHENGLTEVTFIVTDPGKKTFDPEDPKHVLRGLAFEDMRHPAVRAYISGLHRRAFSHPVDPRSVN